MFWLGFLWGCATGVTWGIAVCVSIGIKRRIDPPKVYIDIMKPYKGKELHYGNVQ